jgi:surface antigen
MSSTDHRQNSATEQQVSSWPSQAAGGGTQHAEVEQLSFPDSPVTSDASIASDVAPQVPAYHYLTPPRATTPLVPPSTAADTTRSLIDPSASPNVTRQLGELQTSGLPILTTTTTSLREPVIIRGSNKKKTGMVPPPKGRRLVVHIAVTTLLLFIVLGTLIAVLPTGSDARDGGFNPFKPIMDIVNTKSNNTALVEQQAATATAVTQDGYDPGGGSFAGLPTAPPSYSGGGLGRFFYGQCTYWANMRYHELTGIYIPWLGNAYQWSYGARSSGWIVSGTPKLHSIVVLQPGVQGAGYYGHVAIVESINSDGSVMTSNWNWAGNWGNETYVTFTPGPGVSFVYAPGT